MSKFNNDDFNRELKEMAKDIDIEVPESLRRSVLETLDKLPEKKAKKKQNYKKVAGFLVAGLLTFNVVMPVYAENLPLIGATFKSINEAIGYGEKYVDKATDVDMSKTYDGVTMTINNIYYDGIELAIAYEIKSENGFEKKPVIFPIIKDGFKSVKYKNEIHKGEFKDDNTYVGLASYVFDGEEAPDKTKITFLVNDIYGEWVGYFPEKFKFKFKLDSDNMGKSTYIVNKEFEYEGSKFKIKDVTVSPFNIMIYYDFDTELVKTGEVLDNIEYKAPKDLLDFRIIDEKGMPVNLNGGGYGWDSKEDRVTASTAIRFNDITEEMRFITIVPFVENNYGTNYYKNETVETKINTSEETKVITNSGEEYIINSIDFQDDKTVIDMNIKGYLSRKDWIGVCFVDDQKENIKEIDKVINGIDDKTGYNLTITLPKLDSSKDYYFNVYDDKYIIMEDEKFTIDLNNK